MNTAAQPFDHESPEALSELLKACGACAPAQTWVNCRALSLRTAFEKCRDPEWFRWFVEVWRPDLLPELVKKGVAAMRKVIGSAESFAKHVCMVAGFPLTGDGYGSGYGDGDGSGSGSGYGDGSGYGYGSGSGSGSGYGDGSGSGYGDGSGSGYGSGYGYGYGDGDGDGDGDGSGDGSE